MTMLTLTEFFNTKFFPNHVDGQLNWKTEKSYRETLKHFVRICGDLPLDKVDDDVASKFRSELLKHKGKRAPTMMKSSVGKHITNMKSLLRMAGPRAYCPWGLNLIQTMPYFESPKQERKKPKKDYRIEELYGMFRAADVATFPQLPGIAPVDWWRGLMVFAFYTGLRITALTSVTYDMIFQSWLDIPGEFCKGGEPTRQYVHPEAMKYAEQIRVDGRKQIFGWDGWESKRRYAYNELRKIQAAAGMSEVRRLLAFHSFRATHGTQIVRCSVDQRAGIEAAQRSCGHSDSSITLGHYVNADMMEEMQATIIHRLPSPVPPEFREPEKVQVAQPTPAIEESSHGFLLSSYFM